MSDLSSFLITEVFLLNGFLWSQNNATYCVMLQSISQRKKSVFPISNFAAVHPPSPGDDGGKCGSVYDVQFLSLEQCITLSLSMFIDPNGNLLSSNKEPSSHSLLSPLF